MNIINIRIPEKDIVVTRKVPFTEVSCTELRTIRATREAHAAEELGSTVTLPYPVILAALIHEEFNRVMLMSIGEE